MSASPGTSYSASPQPTRRAPCGLISDSRGELFSKREFLRPLHGCPPAGLTLPSLVFTVRSVLHVFHRTLFDLREDHAQSLLERPVLPVTPASRPRGKSVRDLHDEAYGTLRVRALRELLPDGNGVGKAVNDNVHPTLAPAERGPGFSDRAEEVNDPSFTPHRLKIKLGVPPRTVSQNLRNLIAFRTFIANFREAHRKYPQGITRRRRKEAHIIGLPHIFNTPQGRLYAQSWTRISISGMHDTVARIPKVCDIGTNPLALVFDY